MLHGNSRMVGHGGQEGDVSLRRSRSLWIIAGQEAQDAVLVDQRDTHHGLPVDGPQVVMNGSVAWIGKEGLAKIVDNQQSLPSWGPDVGGLSTVLPDRRHRCHIANWHP